MTWPSLVFFSCGVLASAVQPAANISDDEISMFSVSNLPEVQLNFFYNLLQDEHKDELAQLLINDGLAAGPEVESTEVCRAEDTHHAQTLQLASGPQIRCEDMAVVNGFPHVAQAEVVFSDYVGVVYKPSGILYRPTTVAEQDKSRAVSDTSFSPGASTIVGVGFTIVNHVRSFIVGLDKDGVLKDDLQNTGGYRANVSNGELTLGVDAAIVGPTTVSSGDKIVMRVNQESFVEVVVNDEVKLTTTTKNTHTNLWAKLYFAEAEAQIKDVLWVHDAKQVQVRPCNPVEFEELTNTEYKEGSLQTVGAISGWGAGAYTVLIKLGGHAIGGMQAARGFSFQPKQKDKALMAGLTSWNPTTHYRDIEYAAYCDTEGRFRVFESGEERGTFGSYDENSVVEVVVNHANDVEYRVDGRVRYVSHEPVNLAKSYRVLVSIHETGGTVHNLVWSGAPAALSSVHEGDHPVNFKFFEGLTTPGVSSGELNSLPLHLTNTGTARDANALSVHVIEDTEQLINGFKFQPAQTDKNLAFGLTSKLAPRIRPDADFEVHCRADGSLAVTESGGSETQIAASYSAGDIIEVNIDAEQHVQIAVNAAVKHTTTSKVVFPVAVQARFPGTDASAYNIKWTGPEVCPRAQVNGEPVSFEPLTGVTTLERGHFRKLSYMGDGWNAATASLTKIPPGDNVSGVSFQISSFKKLMVALHSEQSVSDVTADFAAVFETDGGFNIYEKGVHLGQFGQYIPHDNVQITTNALGLTEFTVNGLVRHTSRVITDNVDLDTRSVVVPLYVVVSLHDAEAEIYNIKWSPRRSEDVVRGTDFVRALWPVEFKEVDGVTTTKNGRLIELPTQAVGWNAGAVSDDSLPEDYFVRGVRFTPRFADRWVMIGLSRSGTMMGWQNAEFAAHCHRDGRFVVVEKGEYIGQYGLYTNGQSIEIVVNRLNKVEYKVAGKIRYTSKLPVPFPLSVKSFLYDPQAEAEVRWAGCIEHLPYEGLLNLADTSQFCLPDPAEETPDGLIEFTQEDGVELPPQFQKGALQKMEVMSPGRDGTALSAKEITNAIKSDYTGISAQVAQTDKFVVLGLTYPKGLQKHNGESHDRLTASQIDYAAVLGRNGDFDVYVDGEFVGNFGKYQTDSVIDVITDLKDAGQWCIKFKLDGVLKYTSDKAVTFPMVAAVLIRDTNAIVYNAKWKGLSPTNQDAAEGRPIYFDVLEGVARLEEQRFVSVPIEHSAGDGNKDINFDWAVSTDSIKNEGEEVQGIEFKPIGNNRVTFGLHSTKLKDDVPLLNFALVADDEGNFSIIENGINKGTLGARDSSRPLSIVLTGKRSVEYRVGCEIRHVTTRENDIVMPLYMHAVLYETGTVVEDAVWISSNQCPEQILINRPMVFDRLDNVGLDGPGRLKKFSATGLDWESRAVSTNAIMVHDATLIEGFACKGPQLNTAAMLGFTHLDADDVRRDYYALEHAIFFGANGSFSVWEKGSIVGDFGSFKTGDNISVVVNRDNEVEYRVGSQIRYTSTQKPFYPIKMDAFILNPESVLTDFAWVAKLSEPTPTRPELDVLIHFHRFRGLVAPDLDTDGELEKFTTGTLNMRAWNAGAVSERHIENLDGSVKGVSFRPSKADGHFMVSLSQGSQPSLTTRGINFGVLCLRNGDLQVFENGVFVDNFGTYLENDLIKITVNSAGKVEYRVGPDLLYTSTKDTPLPLFVDVVMHDPGSKIKEVKWAA